MSTVVLLMLIGALVLGAGIGLAFRSTGAARPFVTVAALAAAGAVGSRLVLRLIAHLDRTRVADLAARGIAISPRMLVGLTADHLVLWDMSPWGRPARFLGAHPLESIQVQVRGTHLGQQSLRLGIAGTDVDGEAPPREVARFMEALARLRTQRPRQR